MYIFLQSVLNCFEKWSIFCENNEVVIYLNINVPAINIDI